MRKTDINTIAKPAGFLIILGVLKGYIKHPLRFIIKSKISFNKYKRGIKLDLPDDFIESIGFIAWLYIRLSEKTSKETSFEIIRTLMLTSGLAVQQANFRNVEVPRTFENLKKFQKRANQEGSTKLNTMEIIEDSESKYEFRITRCLFYELFNYLNMPELTSVMCSIDNAIFNSYLPEKLVFHRNGLNNTMVGGKVYCDFVIEKVD